MLDFQDALCGSPVYDLVSVLEYARFDVTRQDALDLVNYFAEKKCGNVQARHKIDLLISKLQITTVNDKTVRDTNLNKKIHDFEDGLQYYSALNSGCKCIVTEDLNDFYFSEIEVLTSRRFLETIVFK